MPRTKVPMNSSNIRFEEIEKKVNDLQTAYESEMFELEDYTKNLCDITEQFKINEVQQFLPTQLNKTLGELRNEVNTTYLESSSIYQALSSTRKGNNTTFLSQSKKSNKKIVQSKQKVSDEEGYITAESTRALSSDRSRGRSPHKSVMKNTRLSRSLSRTKVPKNVTIQMPVVHSDEDRENTPPRQKRMPPPDNNYYITPKVKPNIPLTVLRRPKNGEMAVSMQGSPLLVNGIITEACANVNIPLDNGRVLSLQPCKNMRMSQLPDIPQNTREQLEMLRDHLNLVCGYPK